MRFLFISSAIACIGLAVSSAAAGAANAKRYPNTQFLLLLFRLSKSRLYARGLLLRRGRSMQKVLSTPALTAF